jgi:hypothetical protein
MKGRLIMSCDDHPLVGGLYKDFNIQEVVKVHYSMNRRPGSTPRHCPEADHEEYILSYRSVSHGDILLDNVSRQSQCP